MSFIQFIIAVAIIIILTIAVVLILEKWFPKQYNILHDFYKTRFGYLNELRKNHGMLSLQVYNLLEKNRLDRNVVGKNYSAALKAAGDLVKIYREKEEFPSIEELFLTGANYEDILVAINLFKVHVDPHSRINTTRYFNEILRLDAIGSNAIKLYHLPNFETLVSLSNLNIIDAKILLSVWKDLSDNIWNRDLLEKANKKLDLDSKSALILAKKYNEQIEQITPIWAVLNFNWTYVTCTGCFRYIQYALGKEIDLQTLTTKEYDYIQTLSRQILVYHKRDPLENIKNLEEVLAKLQFKSLIDTIYAIKFLTVNILNEDFQISQLDLQDNEIAQDEIGEITITNAGLDAEIEKLMQQFTKMEKNTETKL